MQVEYDDGDVEDVDIVALNRCSNLAKTHECEDPALGFRAPFLYAKMSFFSQVDFLSEFFRFLLHSMIQRSYCFFKKDVVSGRFYIVDHVTTGLTSIRYIPKRN